MEFAPLLKVEHSSDSPCCCSYLYLVCVCILSVSVSASGWFVFFSLSVSCTHTLSHIQSLAHYLFVMQMLPEWERVHD